MEEIGPFIAKAIRDERFHDIPKPAKPEPNRV